jgi:hypothetical protein
MRKLLLASAAILGVASGQAVAQTTSAPPPAPGPLPPTWTEGPQPTAPSGIAAANNNLNAQGFYTKGPLPAPAPGSIVVHFNGRVVFYGYAENETSDINGGRKMQPYGTLGYFRFFPGVDAMTSGGLRYGASVEIRQQPYAYNAFASTQSSGASAGTYGQPSTQFTALPINYGTGTYLYVRRAFIYLGGNWGALHLGQDDGPIGLLDAGVTTFQTYNDGGWNDDLNNIGNPDTPLFPFPSGVGNEYATSKIVYLSPQIAGFDFSVGFEPDDNALNDAIGANTAFAAGPLAPQLSTGVLATEIARRRNMYEAAARYQGAFGPFGLYAMGGYMGSSKVNRGVGAPLTFYDNLSAFMGGLAVNYGGLRVGGSVWTGATNGQGGALKPAGARNMMAYLAGTQYTLGPLTVGASYMNILSAGGLSAAGTALPTPRREGGINVGGTYVIAPGLLGWLSATYGQRYQAGFDFTTGVAGPDANSVFFKAIALGGMVRW